MFESGVRDDSLAQLVRRLREKIETDAAHPRRILTMLGRDYRFVSVVADTGRTLADGAGTLVIVVIQGN